MNDIFHIGNIAYADVNTEDRFIQTMISKYEYPVYSGNIIVKRSDDEEVKAKFADKYVKRVPEMDKEITIEQ